MRMSLWSNWVAFNNINFLKVMTAIEKKARDFASEFSSQRSLIYGFEKGAEWMLAKVINWLNENADDFYADRAQSDNRYFEVDCLALYLKEAMEE